MAQACLNAFRYHPLRVTGGLGRFSNFKSELPVQMSNSSSPVRGKSAAEMQYSGRDFTSFPPMLIAARPYAIRLLMFTGNCIALS